MHNTHPEITTPHEFRVGGGGVFVGVRPNPFLGPSVTETSTLRPGSGPFFTHFRPIATEIAAPFFALFLSAPQNFLGPPFFQFFAATPARRSCPKMPRIARSARAPSHEFFAGKRFPDKYFFRRQIWLESVSKDFIFFNKGLRCSSLSLAGGFGLSSWTQAHELRLVSEKTDGGVFI